jgi:hypothetical protein
MENGLGYEDSLPGCFTKNFFCGKTRDDSLGSGGILKDTAARSIWKPACWRNASPNSLRRDCRRNDPGGRGPLRIGIDAHRAPRQVVPWHFWCSVMTGMAFFRKKTFIPMSHSVMFGSISHEQP